MQDIPLNLLRIKKTKHQVYQSQHVRKESLSMREYLMLRDKKCHLKTVSKKWKKMQISTLLIQKNTLILNFLKQETSFKKRSKKTVKDDIARLELDLKEISSLGISTIFIEFVVFSL